MIRTLRLLAVLAMIALIISGCSNVPAGTDTGSSDANSSATPHEQALTELGNFPASCRRSEDLTG